MRWPWRRHVNGEAVRAATHEAEEQLRVAREKAAKVDRTARLAGELARGADRFAREVERTMRGHA